MGADGRTITTWSGGVLMNRVDWGKRHPFSRERNYLRAVDIDGRVWSGVGARGMYCTLKLTQQVK